mmetsp:Transcript_30854/g.75239  ORF Transcript_30854/g.75239 Transcript_30854/m.75239 type:complete len:1031 (-) Transcript_30854:172-3264(-)|eukprot:CAMPEP_0114498082 /NCGR_PEP_ID=MMETSP0109-20121206/6683_1 /TAXON_ID=29199 /ORGANISM="Chlorarachnion reptans, Strain CCCM449" /LENGTH=1030 /DNA_ID=CAMNT_0001675537 /DNA_START=104 /DNA_END=3196 /DNA_ORIENTATION=-
MISWVFKPRKKFSLENLKYLYQQLLKNLVVTKKNQNVVVETLRQIAELMIWGDKHNPSFFDFFCEKNILKHCIEILGQKCEKSVKVQVIQSLSILLQNTHSETAVFYLLSNNYINDLIVHKFDFSDEGLLAYYISFLKTLSLKLNPQTIQFFFNEKAQDFPLYTEAIKFFNHQEQMVRIAVRTLTLNVYKVDYEPCQNFILNRSAVPYFSNLVHYIVDQARNIQKLMDASTYMNSKKVCESVANQIDLYYYIQDIFGLGKDFKKDALGNTLMDQLLAHFVLPVLLASLAPQESQRQTRKKLLLSQKLALFLLTQILLVFQHEGFVNAIATCLIHKQPPLLSKWLMHSSPGHPIKSPVPLTTLLYPKSKNHHRRRSRLSSKDRKADESSTSDEGKRRTQEQKMKKNLPRDMNLNARSNLPDVGPVVSPIKACPNYDEPLQSNECRNALMDLIHQGNEDVRYGVVTLFVALLRNPVVNKEILVAGGICPQQHYRKRRLLQELTSDNSGGHGASELSEGDDEDEDQNIVEKPSLGMEDFKVLNKDAINLLLQRRTVDTDPDTPSPPGSAPPAPPPPAFDLNDPEDGLKSEGTDLKQKLPAGENKVTDPEFPTGMGKGRGKDADEGASEVDREHEAIEEVEKLPVQAASESNSGAPKVGQDEEEHLEEEHHAIRTQPEPQDLESIAQSKSPTNTEDVHPNPTRPKPGSALGRDIKIGNNLEYANEVVDALLDALATQPPYRLVTVQMVIDLLGELVLDHTPNPCLNARDVPKLERAYRLAAKDVAKRFTNKDDHDALLNNFQTCFKDMSRPIDIEELLVNALTLLPLATNAMSGIPLQFRRPSGRMEAAKKAIQVYLLLRGLRYKLLKIDDSEFPLTKAYREEEKIQKQQQIQISDQDAIPCVIIVGKRRERHFLVVHRTLLLVVQHHPTRAGYALVKVVVPLRVQEVQRVNSSASPPNLSILLHVGPKPHPSCRPQSAGVWALNLEFEGVEDCNNANQHLKLSREKARVNLIKQLLISLSEHIDSEEEKENED